MEHFTLRCKHCRKLYTYCTYGNGPEYGTEEGCSKEYCAECQTAINKALKEIPIKFKPIKVEIEDDALLKELLEIKNKHNGTPFSWIVSIVQGDYDNVDTYTHDGKTYYVQYNDDTPDDLHLFVEKEYDVANQKVTNNYWKTENGETYIHGRRFELPKGIDTIGNFKLSDRYNMDFDFDFVSNFEKE